ncbi:CPBP family intramembrane glutamic endopeptidase [Salsuginibacillus kocurii]|uniref:CPBP family intramembrane glutamic endopeptidase n=1 Tax=Salsuginibacillus kocurii TaxID=427078 RepID=UPI000367852A|nr:type II CAAX endopeptidase family protein [Salsuginibacillus kocurii]
MNKRYWWIIVVYVLMHLSGIIGLPLLMVGFGYDELQSVVVWTLFSFLAALVIISLLLLPDRHEARLNDDKAGPGSTVLWIVLGFFMAVFAQYLAVILETTLFGVDPESENTQQILAFIESFPYFIIAVAIIGPILEELVFRKVIFGALYKRMNFFWAAFISSLIFAVVHLDFEHLLVYMSGGFVFAFLYVKTNRILVPIMAHVLMNSLAAIGPELEELEENIQLILAWIGGLF